MDEQKLIETAKKVAGDKGLLAMDESNPTCDERFAKWGIPQTVEARRAYREMIVTTPGLGAAMDERANQYPASGETRGIANWVGDRRNNVQVQIKTDQNIEGHQALAAQVSDVVEDALSRFSDRISRVEVQLNDEKGDKPGQRCVMETCLEGRQSIAVTHQASTLVQAVQGAADKLTQLIESTLGRRRHPENRWADSPLDWQKYA